MRHGQTGNAQPEITGKSLAIAVTLLGLLALVIRIWNFAGLPTGCSDYGCQTATTVLTILREDNWSALLSSVPPAYGLILAAIFGLFGPGLAPLQWLGIVLGSLTIPLLYWAASRFLPRASALLGALLLAFLPWHIQLSRYPEPGTLLLPLLLLSVWARFDANQTGNSRRWLLAGLLAGSALLAAPLPLIPALLLWALLFPPLRHWRVTLLYWLVVMVGGLPRLATLQSVDFLAADLSLLERQFQSIVGQILQVHTPAALIFLLLALFGLIYLIRFLRWPLSSFLWVGLLLTLLFAALDGAAISLSTLTPLLLILCLAATVALDQFWSALTRFWSPLIRPVPFLAGASLLLLVVLGFSTRSGLAASVEEGNFATAYSGAEIAIGQFLYERFQTSVDNGGVDNTLILAPHAVLANPTTQLAARGVLAYAKRIAPLDAVEHFPFVGSPFNALPTDSDLLYVLPSSNPEILRLLFDLYESVSAEPLTDGPGGKILAFVIRVPLDRVETMRGLPTLYFAGEQAGPPESATITTPGDALDLDWRNEQPLPLPFTLQNQGALYVPESGLYRFEVEMNEDATLRLLLGDEAQPFIALDTEAGLSANQLELVQGFYPLTLTYQSGTADAHLSVRWQRPGGKTEPIPRQALYSRAVPAGLLAKYYMGNVDWPWLESEIPAQIRREPFIMPGPLAERASALLWQGKLAAPVDGSYTLTVMAAGPQRLYVDNALVLEDDEGATTEAVTLALARGWHDLRLHYRPLPGHAEMQLTWQPAGLQGGPIPPQYFAAYLPDVDTAALTLPDLPESVPLPIATAPLAIQENFQTASDTLPTGLPELPLELRWQVGNCGAGDGQLSEPRGALLMVEENRIYVADTGNRRLVAYDLGDGTPLQVYSDPQLEEPFDLGRTVTGEIFLLDATVQQIFKLDGETLTAIAQDTSFYRPRGLGVDGGGTLLVADTGGARVVILSALGEVLDQIGGPDTEIGKGQPVDVMTLPNGTIWVITSENGTLWRLDRGQGQVAIAPVNTVFGPHLAGLFDSSFFVTDPERRLLLYYSADGQPMAQFQSNLARPAGIDAATAEGNLLVTVTDSTTCTLSLWQMPLDALP